MNKLRSKILDIVEYIIATILVISMVVVLSLQVFFRYVLHAPLYWSEELARILLIWSVFLGANLAFRSGSHMSIDVVSNILPGRLRWAAQMVSQIAVTGFCLVLLIVGFDFARKTAHIIAPATGISMGLVNMVLPLFALLNIFIIWTNPKKRS